MDKKTAMKKALMVLGGVFVILAIVAVPGIAILAVKAGALNKESRQYADTAIRAIISQWDILEIQIRASPEFNAVVSEEDLQKLVKMFRRLGKLKTYNGVTGKAYVSVTSQQGKVISTLYVATFDFDTGPAEIRLSLIKHGNRWQLLAIKVQSKVFLDHP